MISRKRLTSFKKKFRTDILIDEQLGYLKQIEDELRIRELSHKIVNLNDQKDLFEYLYNNENVDFLPTEHNNLKNFDFYEEEDSLDLGSQSAKNLLLIYNRNLIRCHVIRKFNGELQYGRKLLDIAMKKQRNLGEIRQRVAWLESEIEQILLTNKNIQFPMQKKIMNDPNLRVKKIVKIKTPVVEVEERPETVISLTEKPNETFEDAMKRWTKKLEMKSNGSTNSLLESESSQASKAASPIQEETEQELTTTDLHTVKEYLDSNVNGSPDLHKVQEYVEKIPDEFESTSQNFEINTEPVVKKVEIIENKLLKPIKSKEPKWRSDAEKPFYERAHNRFTNPAYSSSVVSKEFNSYHRLGIAVTDSYLQNDDEINGEVPALKKKTKFDSYDLEIIDLAKRMENIYKTNNSVTMQSSRFETAQPTISESSIFDSVNNNNRALVMPKF